MGKVTKLETAAGRTSGGQTVLIGALGADGDISKILRNVTPHMAGGDYKVVTIDGKVNENGDFRKMLSEKASALLSSGPELPGLPQNVSAKYIDKNLLVEKIRASGAGIPAFYVDGKDANSGKQTKAIDGKQCVLEEAVKGHVALIRAMVADREGNARLAAENKGELYLAMSADYAIVIADKIVEIGEIDPEYVHIPGMLVDAVTDFSDLK